MFSQAPFEELDFLGNAVLFESYIAFNIMSDETFKNGFEQVGKY
jgi:hypothetical protein